MGRVLNTSLSLSQDFNKTLLHCYSGVRREVPEESGSNNTVVAVTKGQCRKSLNTVRVTSEDTKAMSSVIFLGI